MKKFTLSVLRIFFRIPDRVLVLVLVFFQTGNSFSLLALPSLTWGIADFGRDIATDASGNVYMTGPGIFLAKFGNGGNNIWSKLIGGGLNEGISIAIDKSANVYIAGNFWYMVDFDPGSGVANLTGPSGGAGDFFFAKYDSSGNYIFAKTIGAGSQYKELCGIAVDTLQNIYVTGGFTTTADFDPGSGTAYINNLTITPDVFFAKYNASGNYLWAHSIGSYAQGIDYGANIALDKRANVYITGCMYGTADFDPGPGIAAPAGNGLIFLAKYNSSGNYQWAHLFDSGTEDFPGTGIAVDGSSNVYFTGAVIGPTDFDPGAGVANLTSVGAMDIFFAKYDASGSYLWAKSIGSTTDDVSVDLALDASGNVYITGVFGYDVGGTADFDPGAGTAILTSGGGDAFFAKYDGYGNYLCAGNVAGTFGTGIAADASGHAYVTGWWSVPGGQLGLSKYNMNCTATPIALFAFTAASVNDNSVLVHWATSSEINNDYFTVERSKDANTWEFVGTVDAARSSTTEIKYSLADKNPHSGTSYYRLKQADKNGQFTYSSIAEVYLSIPEGISIGEVFPNPVVNSYGIMVNSSNEGTVRIETTDILGRSVGEDLSVFPIKQGNNEIHIGASSLASGSYILRIVTGDEVVVKKFLKQ